jgi:hypothetical protein
VTAARISVADPVSTVKSRAPGYVLAAAAVVAALAHVPVIGSHLEEAPYMGVLFVALTAACTVLAAAALLRGGRAVYLLTVLTCGLAVLGYAATRLVAFPMLADDVGNWLEPLGVVSIVSESIAVAAALVALRRLSPRPDDPA